MLHRAFRSSMVEAGCVGGGGGGGGELKLLMCAELLIQKIRQNHLREY